MNFTVFSCILFWFFVFFKYLFLIVCVSLCVSVYMCVGTHLWHKISLELDLQQDLELLAT